MSSPDPFLLLAGDAQDDRLVENVHPRGWTNPDPAPAYNLVVLGAGTAGLVAAVGGADAGRPGRARRERAPGRRLPELRLRAFQGADPVRSGGGGRPSRRGFRSQVGGAVEVDFAAVMERVRGMRARLSENDSAARMKGLGIDVFLGRRAVSRSAGGSKSAVRP